MALPATANFTGTNGNEIRSLADWDGALTDALSGGACEIQSNQAQASASGTIGADWYTSETFNNNQYATATVKAVASGVYIGVAVRCSGTDNAGTLTGYLFYSDSADGCYIDKIVSGSYVSSIAGPGTVFSTNDVIRLEINGSALTAKVNGTTRLTATDSAITAGRPGIAAYSSGASTLDDWEGGNVGAASQTVNANAISSGASVYQPAVTPGAVTVALNAIGSGASVHQPAISQGGSTQTVNANAIGSGASVHQPTVTPGAVTIAPNAIGSGASVHQPAISQGGVTISPNAIASAASVHQPTVTPGAVTIALNAISSTAAVHGPWVLYAACVGGVLTVNATNGRYFDNGTGPLVLAGFHTWQVSGAENSDTDPPAEFDFDEFLTSLTDKGVNATKLWAMETPEDWPNLSPMYFAPLPWARTGPGNAADGKLKFDLTQYDADYFDRMREYAVRLGNAGIYVIVQFFQGWHVAQKGYSDGTPGTYHPFNAANNINSIDGDTDNDGDLVESRDTSLTSIYNLHKAYVEHVIDTLNDLDHILWEVENEGESDLTWQRAIAAYVKSYESGKAKQHPVGLTKLYPGGSNSDLYASDVEWTSIDDDYPTPVPDEADGSMVILWDTDHVLGLTTDWRLSWMSFTRGNNPLYMDEWNGWTYGTDRRADTDAEKYRDNLGYILDYVAQVDIVAMTPQGSLSSTGYALANTEQVLAYQPGSGNFTVDLSGYSGTYAVEYLRTSTGATSTGTTVSGGAVRTMVAPWASEDFAVFLDKQGDEIAPNAIVSTATVYQPALTPGAVTVAADAIASAAQVYAPTLTPGAVTVSPNAIASGVTVHNPALTPGAVTVVADAIASAAQVYAPVVTVGAVTVAVNAISSAATVYEPVITSGGFVVQPDAIASTATVYQVAVTIGAVTVALDAIASEASVHALAVVPGAVTVALEAISSAATMYQPAVTQSAATIYPAAIAGTATVHQPALTPGAVTVAPSAIDSAAQVYAPNVYQGTAQMVFAATIASTAQVFTVAITAIVAGRIYRVAGEDRTWAIDAEDRIYNIGD